MNLQDIFFKFDAGTAFGHVYGGVTPSPPLWNYPNTNNNLASDVFESPTAGDQTVSVGSINSTTVPVYIASFDPMMGAESPRVLVNVTDYLAPSLPTAPTSIIGRCNGPGLVTFTIQLNTIWNG
jgi:hypothetical protein